MNIGYITNRCTKSTKLATTLYIHNIRCEIDKGKLVGSLFVDLSKTIDTIGHSLVLNKLPSYGLNNKILTSSKTICLIVSKLFNTMVQHQNLSHFISILGPLLFLLYNI